MSRQVVSVTPEQAEILKHAHAKILAAQQEERLIACAIAAGFGITNGSVIGLSGLRLILDVPDAKGAEDVAEPVES